MKEAGLDYRKCTRVFEEQVDGVNTGRIVGLVCDAKTFWLKNAMPYPWLPEWTPELTGGPAHPQRLVYPEEKPANENEVEPSSVETAGVDAGAGTGPVPAGTAEPTLIR